tara:strand:+ start:313 stop:438 length:126 start_codon:yes stop_codon:yes gene_type:complete
MRLGVKQRPDEPPAEKPVKITVFPALGHEARIRNMGRISGA